ncbi:MAG: 1,2-phenylacetyl-CoA epoxidase subunit PaaC [Burkholderiales bacterium]
MSIFLPEQSLLTLADTCLLSGHRLSEWCGHGPALEEDIALTNTALDAIGQARGLLQIVAARRGGGATEDSLAYLRDAADFSNVALAAAANVDYAYTVLRSMLLAAWQIPIWDAWLANDDREVAAVAANAAKEARMQWRQARDWVVRFGDGTEESRRRLLAAIDALWPLCPEMLARPITGVSGAQLLQQWTDAVAAAFADATVPMPALLPAASETVAAAVGNARLARAELLAEMQSLARQHAGATW